MVPNPARSAPARMVLAALALVLAATACEYRPLHGATEEGELPTATLSGQSASPTDNPVTSTQGLPTEEATFPAPSVAPGQVTTLAGSGAAGFADGVKTAAQFQFPAGVAVDSAGVVYVADSSNNRIRRIAPDGTVTTLAGSGIAGSADGPGTAAEFNHPRGIAVDDGGTVYVADTGGNSIRAIAPDGSVTTLAGSGKAGNQNAPARRASFNSPVGIAVGAGNTLYVADFQNNTIRRIAPSTGNVNTLAGSGAAGFADGAGAAATFNAPFGITTDPAGNVFVADAGNNRIRKVTPDGTVTTIAGSGSVGFLDGTKDARFNVPEGVAAGPDGSIYVADFGNSAIRKVDSKGRVTTLAGNGNGYQDGSTAEAKFNHPQGIALGRGGVLYVGDSTNNRIRKLQPA